MSSTRASALAHGDLDLAEVLPDLGGRSVSDQFLCLDQTATVHGGDVLPIGSWSANLGKPSEDSFGAFNADGHTGSRDWSPSTISDAFLDQPPPPVEFDTHAPLDAAGFVAMSASAAAGSSSPSLAVMSSPANSSGWPTDSTTPHDNVGDMLNCQSVRNGSSISWPSNGSASGHNQDVFTDTDFDSPQNSDALRIPFHAP